MVSDRTVEAPVLRQCQYNLPHWLLPLSRRENCPNGGEGGVSLV